jgi:hypothetical protein
MPMFAACMPVRARDPISTPGSIEATGMARVTARSFRGVPGISSPLCRSRLALPTGIDSTVKPVFLPTEDERSVPECVAPHGHLSVYPFLRCSVHRSNGLSTSTIPFLEGGPILPALRHAAVVAPALARARPAPRRPGRTPPRTRQSVRNRWNRLIPSPGSRSKPADSTCP